MDLRPKLFLMYKSLNVHCIVSYRIKMTKSLLAAGTCNAKLTLYLAGKKEQQKTKGLKRSEEIPELQEKEKLAQLF